MTEQERRVRILRLKQAQMKAQQPTPATAPVDVRGEGGGRGTALEAGLIGARQGVTLGFGDEINAGVRAAGDWLGGKPFGESYDARLAQERALLDQTRRENPIATTAGEIGGSVLLPGGAVGTAKTVAGAAARSGLAGAGFGGLYGAGNATEGERLEGLAKGAAGGALFGAGAGAAIGVGTRAFQNTFNRAMRKPTVEGLREVRTAAYRAVDEAGETFAPTELQGMAQAAREAVESLGTYVEDVDAQTRAALQILDRNSGTPLTIGQVDKIRQSLWKRANAAPNEPGVRLAIEAIDDMIASRADTSELMAAARVAHGTYKKAELIERAFKRAEDQTASTGSGGNILNKYRQAVTRIINDPRQAKWFTADEKAAMQKVIDGGFGDDFMRRVGKLSPDGNGLMLFLNLLGNASMGPGFLGVTAAGAGAKAISDARAQQSAQRIFDVVSGGAPARTVSVPQGVNALAGYSGSSF